MASTPKKPSSGPVVGDSYSFEIQDRDNLDGKLLSDEPSSQYYEVREHGDDEDTEPRLIKKDKVISLTPIDDEEYEEEDEEEEPEEEEEEAPPRRSLSTDDDRPRSVRGSRNDRESAWTNIFPVLVVLAIIIGVAGKVMGWW